ncbi:MAG: patatin-like phospholipase family protein [Ignavibacteriales bacterium]
MALPAHRKIGIALGGGVVRGIAHVGVLQAIEELGIEIECIAGTSSGAIVGAMYAAGIPLQEIVQIAAHAKWRDLAEISVRRDGLIGTRKLAAYLDSVIGGKTFDDLRIRFKAVATDICTGQEVVISSGPVCDAVRASCAIPGIFVPVRLGGRMLVDGGLCNNVPASVAREMGASYVVAVDLNALAMGTPPPRNVFQIILHAHDIMQRANVEKEAKQADLLIQPDLSGLSLIDFNSAREFMDKGAAAARAALQSLAVRQ